MYFAIESDPKLWRMSICSSSTRVGMCNWWIELFSREGALFFVVIRRHMKIKKLFFHKSSPHFVHHHIYYTRTSTRYYLFPESNSIDPAVVACVKNDRSKKAEKIKLHHHFFWIARNKMSLVFYFDTSRCWYLIQISNGQAQIPSSTKIEMCREWLILSLVNATTQTKFRRWWIDDDDDDDDDDDTLSVWRIFSVSTTSLSNQ